MTQNTEAFARISLISLRDRIALAIDRATTIAATSALRAIRSEADYTEPSSLDRSVLVAVTGIEILDGEQTEDNVPNGSLIAMLRDEALSDIRAAAVREFIR